MTGIRDPIDFLPRLCSGERINHFPANPKEENIELSLGLSLNGGYGLEQKRFVGKDNNNNNNNNSNKLFRASSVTDIGNIPVDVELTLSSGITRTCSLPPEREVEWRKRKEMQSLRRSEAKRKRVEKMKSVVIVKGKTEEGGLKRSPPSVLSPAVRFSSQGSIGSQESGGSSGVSDLDSQPFSDRETSETNDQSKHNKVKCNLKSEHNKVKCNLKTNAEKQRAYNETMPCVSTKGDGPDGKRIQGFLYRYGKGEEVRIVCVCHGSFLTPAEFVKHGGGGDVDHPLKHIVVTSLLS